jgi:dephospho-CoA kinase
MIGSARLKIALTGGIACGKSTAAVAAVRGDRKRFPNCA